MAELNIKKEIGRRIHEARKSKGLTLRELGQLCGSDFKQTRLTNWEQGTRAPGPEEIKQLAEVLEVSPAFLMCLSDEKQLKQPKGASQLIPLLDQQEACNAQHHIIAVSEQEQSEQRLFIAVSTVLLPTLSSKTFALRMLDESMTPGVSVGDVLVIDCEVAPRPGDYVAVKLQGKAEVIICQYKKLSYTSSEFELLTLNDNWPNIKVCDGIKVDIIGTVMQNIRSY